MIHRGWIFQRQGGAVTGAEEEMGRKILYMVRDLVSLGVGRTQTIIILERRMSQVFRDSGFSLWSILN